MNAETHGMTKNGAKDTATAKPLHLAVVISAMRMSFMVFRHDWPKMWNMYPAAYVP